MMKNLFLALSLCALPIGICAMEKKYTSLKEEIVGHKGEAEKANAQDLAEISTVKQLLIDGYAADGEREAMKRLIAYFEKPLAEIRADKDPMIRISSAEKFEQICHDALKRSAKRVQFIETIMDEVLQKAEEISADPASANIESINAILGLLVAVKLYDFTYLKAVTYIKALEKIKKEKQASNL